ncbi:ExbD/TolR family protein [Mucilaginibacter sp. OK098]|uniref:ExbD/TolR family protein n=1 Tax=Mucilaginibacter sp. OK098 TaxID=1855297 RepID=UPI00091B9991|nr:biopolymer transporter ExbD [Mucilaginibacter sp. OK098]SHN34568.1 Biopolymer transport protein ExbD/TolR [Mucilaginibacter sp. OK098]
MYNGKLRRKTLSVDMTAMCDVGFLILIFLMLFSKPKILTPYQIERPKANGVAVYDPSGDEVIITIVQGRVMYEIPTEEDRALILAKIGARHHINFTPEELKKFKKISVIGVPIDNLKQFIDSYYNDETFANQPGMHVNHTHNELVEWIKATRAVSMENHGRDVPFIINADKKTLYPIVETVMNILGSQKIFKMSLYYDVKHKI